MLNAFYNPKEAILDAKKLGGWVSTLVVLAISSVLFAVTPLILFKEFHWKMFLVILAGVIVGSFLAGLFLKLAVSILGAKNPYYFESVTSLVYGTAPFALSVFIASLLFMIPKAGIHLAALSVVIGGIATIAAKIRAVAELTKTDILTAFIALWVVGITAAAMTSFVFAWPSLLAIAKFFMSFAAVA